MDGISFQDFFDIGHRVEVRINVTNACNLHCDHCDHDAHLPFDKHGAKVFRAAPLLATPEGVEQFCRALAGVGEDDRHVLQGGEITVLPVKQIARYIDILASYGRRVGMRTNGYNLMGIPLDSLRKLDFIYLNAHGNNQSAIQACGEFLASHYGGQVIDEENLLHRDLSAYLHHGQGTVEQAINCSHLMSTLTFLSPVVHPCCNSWALMNALNSEDMRDQLIGAGWTVDNADLRGTLANWRQTLPKPFLKLFCADSCYLSASREMSPQYRIQIHHGDRVLRRARGDHLA
jgi:hypothetical protein